MHAECRNKRLQHISDVTGNQRTAWSPHARGQHSTCLHADCRCVGEASCRWCFPQGWAMRASCIVLNRMVHLRTARAKVRARFDDLYYWRNATGKRNGKQSVSSHAASLRALTAWPRNQWDCAEAHSGRLLCHRRGYRQIARVPGEAGHVVEPHGGSAADDSPRLSLAPWGTLVHASIMSGLAPACSTSAGVSLAFGKGGSGDMA